MPEFCHLSLKITWKKSINNRLWVIITHQLCHFDPYTVKNQEKYHLKSEFYTQIFILDTNGLLSTLNHQYIKCQYNESMASALYKPNKQYNRATDHVECADVNSTSGKIIFISSSLSLSCQKTMCLTIAFAGKYPFSFNSFI